jgi:imidazolonepropionase-like amidohydrolase
MDIYYLKAKRLVDGSGKPPLENAAIIVEGDRIKAVGHEANLAIPPEARIIDLKNRTMLPGMIDAHVHLRGVRRPRPGSEMEWLTAPEGLMALRAAADARDYLRAGFTSLREMGSIYGPGLKRAIQEGAAVGPRLVAARQMITQTGGHGAPQSLPPDLISNRWHYCIVDGADAVRRAVREQVRGGADVIKVCATGDIATEVTDWKIAQFTLEELQAAVDEAKRSGRMVAAHAEGLAGIRTAVDAGVDTIEHGSWLDEEVCRKMADQGTFLIPTVRVMQEFALRGADMGHPEWRVRKGKEVYQAQQRTFNLALKHNLRVAMGTDSSSVLTTCRQGVLELESMVMAGLSNMQAICATTSVASQALGLEHDVGILESKKLADIIAVDGDPVADIKVLQNIAFVMKGGAIFIGPSQT